MSEDKELERIRQEKAKIIEKMGITILPNTPSEVVHIANEAEWQEFREKHANVPIAIDFSATWCMPCKFFQPIFAKIQSEFADKMAFVHVDIDEFPELANGFGVTGVPTTSIIFGDKELERQVGAAPEPMFRQMVQKVLQKLKR
jgi:thioredoxin